MSDRDRGSSSRSHLRLRPYQPGDEDAINDGFCRAFHVERSLDAWRWKFPEQPEGRWIYLAVDEAGEVVSHYAAVPVRARLGALRLRVGQVVDAFCLHRAGLSRRGTFHRTVEFFFRDMGGPERLALLFGFPSERHLRLGTNNLGYGSPAPVELWERQGPGPAPRRAWPGYRLERGFRPEVADRLWARASHRYPFAGLRDAAWLSRRYAGRPGVEYLHLTASRWGKPRAWAVLVAEGAKLRWLDLVWDGGDPRALEALDRGAEEWGRELGATAVEMWLRGDARAEQVLEDRGMVRRAHPQGLQLTVRSFHPRIDAEAVTRQLYYTLGDSDLA